MANKSRVLYLLQFLQRNSDEEHSVTTADIRHALADKGCPATVETVRNDICTLQETGYEIEVIETNGLPTRYSYIDRDFDIPELQVLIDAVASSQFISKAKSEQLIKKLVNLTGPSHVAELQPSTMTAEYVKTQNSQLLIILQKIKDAIQSNHKISFEYYRYDLNKKRIPRRDSEEYSISPFATIWKNDRYFLIGYSDRRRKVVVFRVDRMSLPKILNENRVPKPEEFCIRDYTEKIFGMYDEGKRVNVTLLCRHHMIDHIIDYFGMDVIPKNVNKETFEVTIPISLSNPFYSWLVGFAGDMTIKGPPEVKKEYVQFLKQGIDEAEYGIPSL